MFSNKTDVDRHVREVFNKLTTDAERDAKCYMFAKLYFKIKDYENAIKYVNRYITHVKNTAQCQRLLGDCYDATNQTSKALEAYKTSLELDGGQRELVLKVCELLCDPELSLVHSQASYWLTRLRQMYPQHPIVFKLSERLLKDDPVANKDPKKLENLILSEILARPNDMLVRIRLLDLLIETNRAKTAHEQAIELLAKGLFCHEVSWFECLNRVNKAYEKECPESSSLEFQLRKLTVLERLSYLTLEDLGADRKSIIECGTAVFSFDQALHAATLLKLKSTEKTVLDNSLVHFYGQLASHLAILKLKRAKAEPGEWERAVRIANPLLMLSTRVAKLPSKLSACDAERWRVEAALRCSMAIHVLRAQATVKGSGFLQEVNESCGGKWRDRVYDKIFYNKEHQEAKKTSCFINNPFFLDMPIMLPTDVELEQFDKDAQFAFPQHLHYFAWQGVANLTANGNLKKTFRSHVFRHLQVSCSNLQNTYPETLNQLDIDAFLYATVLCSQSGGRHPLSSHRPPLLPPTISPLLCSQFQSDWWSSIYKLKTTQTCDQRALVRRGIESVRAVGHHGLHPKLLVLLAQQFQLRANNTNDLKLKEELEARIKIYWEAALPLLKRQEKNLVLSNVTSKLFDYHPGDWKADDIVKAIEDGKLFLACQMMKEGEFEDAIDALQSLKSPLATYHQAVIYKKLAESSESDDAHRGFLLIRARDALRLTEHRLRRAGNSISAEMKESIHQLAAEVSSALANDVNDVTGKSANESWMTDPGVTGLDITQEVRSPATPRQPRHNTIQSTPRPSQPEPEQEYRNGQPKSPQSNENLVDEMGLVRNNLGEIKSLLQDLLSEFKKLSVKLTERPVFKTDDLFEFAEPDDYVDDVAAYSGIQQQAVPGAASAAAPIAPASLAAHPSLMQYCAPSFMWHGGLPFSEGQQLPDFRGAVLPGLQNLAILPGAPAPIVAPAVQPDFSDSKHVPNVEVTSSDVLPAFSRNTQPVMSVTIPAEHVRSAPRPHDAPVTPGTHAFQIPLPPQQNIQPPMVLQSPSDKYQARAYDQPTKSLSFGTPPVPTTSPLAANKKTEPSPSTNQKAPTNSSLNSSRDDDAYVDTDYDPRPDFQPIVSLPEVEVRTGEEGETLLFSSPARLFVHRNAEWKERGRGEVKILHDEKTNKVRVLMRRDQVHKICANHHIHNDMKLSLMPNTQNAFNWVAHDYSDEKVSVETFCIKFQSLDQGKDFEYAFNKGREISLASSPAKTQIPATATITPPKTTTATKSPLLATPTLTFGAKTTPSSLFNPAPVPAPKSDALMNPDKPVFGEKVSSAFDLTTIAKGGVADAFKSKPNFSFAGAGKPLFADTTPKNNTSNSGDAGEDNVEEFEPSVDFAPIIPLPDLVEVKTGEEDEIVVYEHRAKILRFATETKEWKEKGVGNVKLLQHPSTGKIRIVMRRDQVHKVCCNHHLDETMNFERMTSSDKAATWTAQDFSEGEPKPELLAIRFGKVETLIDFLQIVQGLQKKMKNGKIDSGKPKANEVKNTAVPKPLSELFKKKPGTWECNGCFVQNKADVSKCVACEAPKPGDGKPTKTEETSKPLSELFKKQPGSWDCDTCLVRNKPDSNKCLSCESPRPGCEAAAESSKPSPKGLVMDPSLATKFSFGIPAASPAPAAAPAPAQPAPAFSFGSSTTPFTFGTAGSAPATGNGFLFGTPPAAKPAAGFTFAADANKASPQFSFGGAPSKAAVNGTPDGGDFKMGSSDKFSFTFNKPVATPEKRESEQEHSDEELNDLEREDDSLIFKPVVPLPDKVEIHTGEEDEEIVYSQRAKLYRFTDEEWKERGVGDLKILKHKQTRKVRLLMRREQVLKICLNHYLLKEMEFLPKQDRAWLWSAADFSEGTMTNEKFCVRFRDNEMAAAFKAAIDREQATLGTTPQRATEEEKKTPRGSSASRALFKEDEPELLYEYEHKATPEQRAEAERLKLPKNWFKYEDAKPCPGCAGCDDESVKSVSGGKPVANPQPAGSEQKKAEAPKPESAAVSSSTAITSTPVLQFGQLPKPTEALFSKFAQSDSSAQVAKPAEETPKSSVFANFSFKNIETPKSGGLFGQSATPAQPIFGSASGNIFGASKPVFGAADSTTPSTAPVFGTGGVGIFGGAANLNSTTPVFNAEPEFSFTSIAQQNSTNIFGGKSSAPGWNTEIKPMFGGARTPKAETGSDSEGGGEDDDHDPQFQPIIDLPAAIEVRTGEEDEDKLFSERAKLYRYDSALVEWKERGVGDMKVLFHPQEGTYRLLLRRAQVHKIVCNMRITADLELKPMPKSPNSWLWVGSNFIEGEMVPEQLAVRFKLESSADLFKRTVDDCVLKLRDLSLAKSNVTETECYEELTDSSGDDDEYDEDGDDDYSQIIISKDGVSLSQLNEDNNTYDNVATNLTLQVLESDRPGREGLLRIILIDEEGALQSDTRVDPSQETLFKVPPLSMMWVAPDMILASDDYKTLRVDLLTKEDAQDLFETVNAQDLP